MANIHTFAYNIKSDVAMVPIALNNTANTPIYFSMANYDLAVFLVVTGAVAGGGSATIQMRQRVGAAGAEANLGAAGAIADTQSGTVQVFQSRGAQMTVNSGYTHVGILITAAGGVAVLVGAILLRLRARYKQATLPA